MNTNTIRPSTASLGSEAHTWEQAVEFVTAARLEDPLRRWLRDSGLPGASGLAVDGSWSPADRLQFLKLLCGEPE